MIVFGVAFLGAAVIGKYKDYFNLSETAKIASGAIGGVLLVIGLTIYLISAKAPETGNSTSRETKSSPAAGSQPRKLISSPGRNTSPQFSPDASRIAFQSSRSGNEEIWVCDLGCAAPVQLTNLRGGAAGSPRWSPDGTQIAFDSRHEGNSNIYVIASNGGQARRITPETTSDAVRPSWSQDGRWIYFGSNRGAGTWQVWRMAAAGGPATRVTNNGGREAFEGRNSLVYYTKLDAAGIWSVPAAGGQETRVVDAGMQGLWALGDQGIYFLNGSAPGIQFLNLATATPRDIAVLPRDAVENIRGFTVARDGRSVLYAQGNDDSSEIFLAAVHP
jgi:hypothetical protein